MAKCKCDCGAKFNLFLKVLFFGVLGICAGIVLGLVFGVLIGYISDLFVTDLSLNGPFEVSAFFGMGAGAIVGGVFGGWIGARE